jgi:alcohol dehydrogenase class IV
MAVGSGSPIDAAKGMSILATNDGDIEDYEIKELIDNMKARNI